MATPYIGFGNDQLAGQPTVNEGDIIECPHCLKTHKVEFGTDETGKKTNILGFYSCGEKTFLACVAGKLVMGLKAACSGKV